MIRTPADGAAEALFGIAASLTDAPSADVSILYLRMALYLRPDLGLAQILLADRFETLQKYDDAIAIYHAIAHGLALLPHGGRCRRRWMSSGWARMTRPSPI